MMTGQDVISVREGLSLINSLCDGAVSLDGVGFNKFDTKIAKNLLSLPVWTEKQLELAYNLLRKYRGQLLEFYGIGIENIDRRIDLERWVVKDDREERQGERIAIIYPNKKQVIFKFPYDAFLVREIKTNFKNRTFLSSERAWLIKEEIEKAEEFAQKYQFKKVYRYEGMGKVWMEEDQVVLKFDYDPKLIDRVKKLGMAWDKQRMVWTGTLTPEIASFILDLIKDNFEVKDVERMVEVMESIESSIVKSQKASSDFDVPLKNGSLLPYQRAGVEYIINKKKVLLADVMGLGKTLQAIASVYYLKDYPALVICPASLKINWKREIERWTGDKKIVILNGKDEVGDLSEYNWVIINYDILKKWEDKLLKVKWKSLIVDESHYVKNTKAQRTKIVMEIAEENRKNLDLILLLSGTPMTNRPVDLISQLKILGIFKNLFKSVKDFQQRFCIFEFNGWGYVYKGAKNIETLNQILRSSCMIRREKEDVLKELPEKVVSYIPVNLPNEYMEEYKHAQEDIASWTKKMLKESGASPEEILDRLTRLERGETIVKLNRLREIAGKGKVEVALKWIEDFFEENENEKLVVFALHKEVQKEIYERCKKMGLNPARISGDEDVKVRQENIDKFQNDDTCRVIVVSILAGGVGITLTKASYCLFVELDWTPANLSQAEDRLHRIGQKNTVFVYYLIAEDTIDERLKEMIENKKDITEKGISYANTEVIRSILFSFLNV